MILLTLSSALNVARSSLMWRNGSDACRVGIVNDPGDKRIFRDRESCNGTSTGLRNLQIQRRIQWQQ